MAIVMDVAIAMGMGMAMGMGIGIILCPTLTPNAFSDDLCLTLTL